MEQELTLEELSQRNKPRNRNEKRNNGNKYNNYNKRNNYKNDRRPPRYQGNNNRIPDEEFKKKRSEQFQEQFKEKLQEKFQQEIEITNNNVEKKKQISIDDEEIELREDTIHLYGVDHLSTQEIMEHFQKYIPKKVEWLNDSSCNVLLENPEQVDNCLQEMVINKEDQENDEEEQKSENGENKQEEEEEGNEKKKENKEDEQQEEEDNQNFLTFSPITPFVKRGKKIQLLIRPATNKDVKGSNISGKNSIFYSRYNQVVVKVAQEIKDERKEKDQEPQDLDSLIKRKQKIIRKPIQKFKKRRW